MNFLIHVEEKEDGVVYVVEKYTEAEQRMKKITDVMKTLTEGPVEIPEHRGRSASMRSSSPSGSVAPSLYSVASSKM